MTTKTMTLTLEVPQSASEHLIRRLILEYLNSLPIVELSDSAELKAGVCPHCGMSNIAAFSEHFEPTVIQADGKTVWHNTYRIDCKTCNTLFLTPVSDAYFHEDICSDEANDVYLLVIPKSLSTILDDMGYRINPEYPYHIVSSVPVGNKAVTLTIDFLTEKVHVSGLVSDPASNETTPLPLATTLELDGIYGNHFMHYIGEEDRPIKVIIIAEEELEIV